MSPLTFVIQSDTLDSTQVTGVPYRGRAAVGNG